MMLEGVGDRSAVVPDEIVSTHRRLVDKPQDLARSAQSVERATDAAPAAVVQLSPQAEAALAQRGAEPARDHPIVDDKAERPPPAPQQRRIEAQPSEALARYRQLSEDPASSFFAENSPFRVRAGTGAPIEAVSPQVEESTGQPPPGR